MRQSQLFTKTSKQTPKDEQSINAQFLLRAGMVDKLMAGVYTYLPLGLRVLNKINGIIREEMNAIGAQEILMPALQPREPWQITGRWQNPGTEVMFQFKGRQEKDLGLGWTHEEIVTPLVKQFVKSYKDLPVLVYQIQDKFRNEPRAKSGLLRGREFNMKDLYSFHADEESLNATYETVARAYDNIYRRCGLQAIKTEASGGDFSPLSHEYQVLTPSGEDVIYYCQKCLFAQNREISKVKTGDKCPQCQATVSEGKAIEVGNIFKLKNRFTDAFKLTVTDMDGKKIPVMMGCYGIGPSRVLGAIVEVHHDEHGIIWPTSVAPFQVHLMALFSKDAKINKKITGECEKLYRALQSAGIEVMFDDREDESIGEKLSDADLIGLPTRVIISQKTLGKGVELKQRGSKETKLMNTSALFTVLKQQERFGGL